MSDTSHTTAEPTAAKSKKVAVALRDWIDSNGHPVESGAENTATGLRYTHLPTARAKNPAFNPETDKPDASAVFEIQFGNPGSLETMLAIFGGLTLAGNVVNTAVNGPKGDPSVNPIPLITERFAELDKGVWADRATGVGGVRYDKEKLSLAIAMAKGEATPDGSPAATAASAPYLAKMEHKVDPKTGAVVAGDAKGAISYGAFALRNAKVKSAYDALTGGGVQIDAL